MHELDFIYNKPKLQRHVIIKFCQEPGATDIDADDFTGEDLGEEDVEGLSGDESSDDHLSDVARQKPQHQSNARNINIRSIV